MDIENFCEYIKQIHADPFKVIDDLTIKDMQNLQQHVQTCQECGRLVDEVIDQHRDVKPDPNFNDGRFN